MVDQITQLYLIISMLQPIRMIHSKNIKVYTIIEFSRLHHIRHTILQLFILHKVAKYIIFILTINKMKIRNILCFLFVIAVTIALPFTQQEVDSFIRLSNMVPPQAALETYNIQNDRSVVVYQSQMTKWKFVIGQTLQGKPYVIFRQQMTEIKFNTFGGSARVNQPMMIQQMPMMNQMPIMTEMPLMPMMPIPMPVNQQFNHQVMNGGFLNIQQPQQGQVGPRRTCRIDEEQVKILLKDSLTIFKDGEIQKIEKVGFERGTGIILEITLLNDKKNYKVKAGYMPRWGKLSILKIEEVPAATATATENKNNPLQTGKQLIGKIVNENIPKNPFPKVQEAILAQQNIFDNLIQTFVEKLLVRKSVQGKKELETETKSDSIVNPPFLLGSQGEPENVQTPHENTENIAPEPPLLLGSKDENPFGYQVKAEQTNEEKVEHEEIEDHQHKEANSEQISELVTEVLNKIKLKTK